MKEMQTKEAIREAKRIYAREWRKRNREKYNRYHREYYWKNRDRIQAIQERHWINKAKEMGLYVTEKDRKGNDPLD